MTINSPAQTVVVDTQAVVPEPPAPKDQEFGNPKVSEIQITPIKTD